MTVKALIFDFDGLIIDTEFPIYNAIRRIYRRYHQDLPLDDYTFCIGSDIKDDTFLNQLQDLIHQSLDYEALQKEIRQNMLAEIAKNPVLPGVLPILQQAQALNIPCLIASSSERKWVVGYLEKLGLIPYFMDICTSEDVVHVKPEPDLFLLALQKAKAKPNEAIVFEDSSNGIIAAYRAGIFSVAVPSEITKKLDFSKANLVLHRIDEIPLQNLLTKVI
jgi:HAD superfamily hydrolase (TIGR01509 family)